MGIIITIIIGFVVGLIARALMPGKDVMGFILTALLGIGGALIGKFIGQGLGLYEEGEPAGFFMSLLGALVLLFIYNYFRTKNPPA
ncbi:MAG: GlsB/YeaQ/YmgE family stress response membrane protein [Parachlamydiaceae bacterium]|nr:GlsB/YeaQ/YmgE family stress response membrane protein [Parachlamydiaceae bacterium]